MRGLSSPGNEAHAPPPPGGRRKDSMMGKISEVQVRFFKELAAAGINLFDLGVSRSGKFQQRGLGELTLTEVLGRLEWLRAENRAGTEIYFRPAGKFPWTVFVLDDLTPDQAEKLGKKYQAWIVETSPGRLQSWILTNGKPLLTWQRYAVQRKIVDLGWGDPGAVSGDRFGRIPGFKNWKRGGQWVNLIGSPNNQEGLIRLNPWGRVLNLSSAGDPDGRSERSGASGADRSGRREDGGETDRTASGAEFGWCCGWLRKGLDPEEAIRRLTLRAQERGKTSPEKYARRTIESAKRAVDSWAG